MIEGLHDVAFSEMPGLFGVFDVFDFAFIVRAEYTNAKAHGSVR